jgi:hypothetical protein
LKYSRRCVLPPIARDNIPESVLVGAGYTCAALMCGLGTLNMIIAVTLPFAVAWFISVGAMGAKIVAGRCALLWRSSARRGYVPAGANASVLPGTHRTSSAVDRGGAGAAHRAEHHTAAVV